MMRAPGGPGTKQPSIVEMHRARVGIGTESEARQMGFRLHTPARPSGARLGSARSEPEGAVAVPACGRGGVRAATGLQRTLALVKRRAAELNDWNGLSVVKEVIE